MKSIGFPLIYRCFSLKIDHKEWFFCSCSQSTNQPPNQRMFFCHQSIRKDCLCFFCLALDISPHKRFQSIWLQFNPSSLVITSMRRTFVFSSSHFLHIYHAFLYSLWNYVDQTRFLSQCSKLTPLRERKKIRRFMRMIDWEGLMWVSPSYQSIWLSTQTIAENLFFGIHRRRVWKKKQIFFYREFFADHFQAKITFDTDDMIPRWFTSSNIAKRHILVNSTMCLHYSLSPYFFLSMYLSLPLFLSLFLSFLAFSTYDVHKHTNFLLATTCNGGLHYSITSMAEEENEEWELLPSSQSANKKIQRRIFLLLLLLL